MEPITYDEVARGFSTNDGITAYGAWALGLLIDMYGYGPYTEEQWNGWAKASHNNS